MDSARRTSDVVSTTAFGSTAAPGARGGRIEGTWADVESAQRALQHRFRPRWWFHLPEVVVFAGLMALISADALGPLYWVLLIVLILMRCLYLGVQRAQPLPGNGVSAGSTVVLAIVGLVLVLSVLGVLGAWFQDMVRQGWLIVGLGCGLLGCLLTRHADRRNVRLLGTAGMRLATRNPVTGRRPAPRRHEVLDDAGALRAVMLVGSVRDVERSALQEDLGLPPEETARLLEELVRLRLVDAHRKLIAGGWRRTWLVLTTTGLSALSGHLAALDDTARQETA